MGNSTYMVFQAGQPNDQPKRDPSKPNKFLKPGPEGQVGFNSQQDFLDAIDDDRYSAPGPEGEEYREAVQIVLRNSNLVNDPHSNEGKRAQAKQEALTEEDRQCAMESAQELFNNPVYETSPTYRRFVRQQIEANSELIDKTLGKQINGGTRIKPTRIQFTGEDYAEVQAGIRKEREDKLKADAKDAADAAARRAAAPFVDVLGGNDDEGSEE